MFTQHHLANGIKVILAPSHATAAVTLLVLIKVGSRYETAAANGISHFLEHLMFKGTKQRPSTLAIAHELDAIGADYNAYTSKDHTGYFIKAEASHLPLIVDILADILSSSIFAPEEVERERGAILEEINMYEDNPMAKVEHLFEEDMFGGQTALGRYIIGTASTVKSISRQKIFNYWHKHYCGANLVLALAGCFEQKPALALLNEKFGCIKAGARNEIKRASFSHTRPAAAHYKETNQAHLLLGFPGLPYTHPQLPILSLLAIILGGNMSSRLFISVREQLGLCYFIRAGLESYEETGVFSVQAGLDLTKIDKALAAVAKEFRAIKERLVGKSELLKARDYFKGKTVLDMEDSFDVAALYGRQAMFEKNIITPKQLFVKFDKITPADLQRLARKILERKKLQLTLLAPFKDIKRFARFIDI